MAHLLKANFYRIRNSRWFRVLLAANIVFVLYILCSGLVDMGLLDWMGAVQSCASVFLAIVVNAVFLCPLFCTDEIAGGAVSRRLAAGYSRTLAVFVSFLSCFLTVALFYTIEFICFYCMALWREGGFSAGAAADHLSSLFGGYVVAAVYCACFTLLSFTAKKGVFALIACLFFCGLDIVWFLTVHSNLQGWYDLAPVLEYMLPGGIVWGGLADPSWSKPLWQLAECCVFGGVCLFLLYKRAQRIEL